MGIYVIVSVHANLINVYPSNQTLDRHDNLYDGTRSQSFGVHFRYIIIENIFVTTTIKVCFVF